MPKWPLAFVVGILSGAAARAEAQDVHDHVNMGVAAMQAHDLDIGLSHFEAALALDSTDYDGQLARGRGPDGRGRGDSRHRP